LKTLRLGLIGGNITESRSPALQIICGLSIGRNVTYDLLIPTEQGMDFAAMVVRCQNAGFDGVNVTYPYKEEVLKSVKASNPVVAAIGASNTVRFSPQGATAWNTDYSGFIAAYRACFGTMKPGHVLMLGAGGAGRAIAFALAELGADELTLFDLDKYKANLLGFDVHGHSGILAGRVEADGLMELSDYDGIVNCTPLGMAGREGSALPTGATGKPRWAFDAVYTPEHTLFRTQTESMGAEFLSGYELYFNQGIQGFKIFSGREVRGKDWVRQVLAGK
jgi:shikimate dehydrogenase